MYYKKRKRQLYNEIVHNKKKEEKILKMHQYYICYGIGQKADMVFISSNTHPPNVCLLFGKKKNKQTSKKEKERRIGLSFYI